MSYKTFLSLFSATLVLSGYPVIQPVQANEFMLMAQSIWKPFSSTPGGFTVLMPGTPTTNNTSVNTEIGVIPIQLFTTFRPNEAVYLVAYSDFPSNIPQNSRDINKFLSAVASGFSQGAGGKLISEQNISLNNFPGKEIKLQFPQGVISIGRIYLVNKRLYQVVVVTKKERDLTQSINGFFNSFRLVNQSSASPKVTLESLNAQLRQSVCNQNWSQSVRLINQMLPITPNSQMRSELVTYQRRLQNLAASRSKIPTDLLTDCKAGR